MEFIATKVFVRASTSVLLNFLSILHALLFLFYTITFTKHPHQFIYFTRYFNKIFILLNFFYHFSQLPFTYMLSLSLSLSLSIPNFSDLLLSLYTHFWTQITSPSQSNPHPLGQIFIETFTAISNPSLSLTPSLPRSLRINIKHLHCKTNKTHTHSSNKTQFPLPLSQISFTCIWPLSCLKHHLCHKPPKNPFSLTHKHRLSTNCSSQALIVPLTLIKHRSFQSSIDLSLCWFVRVGLFVCGCVCVSLCWFVYVDVFVCGCVCVYLRKKKMRRGEVTKFVVHREEREKKVRTWN